MKKGFCFLLSYIWTGKSQPLPMLFSISLVETGIIMKNKIFKFLSKLNKKVLPGYSKQQLDLQKATNFQKAIIGWKLWVTKNALD